MKQRTAVTLIVIMVLGFMLYLYSPDVLGRSSTDNQNFDAFAENNERQADEEGATTQGQANNEGVATEEQADQEGPAKGQADEEVILEGPEDNNKEKDAPTELSYIEENIVTSANGKMVTNPDDILVLVNKNHNLPANYEPSDLVYLTIPFQGGSSVRYMRREASVAIENLFSAAKEAGIKLAGVSGYRSYSVQKRIFDRNFAAKGEEANRFSARPGQSEHQTGLALDVSNAEIGYALKQIFGKTKAGRWVVENAHNYGFIIRYPKGKEHITGYIYEPWHLRYVGVEAATEIMENQITLEEYLKLP